MLDQLGHLDSVMDVACGPGRFAPVLADHCRWLVQTDYSAHMLDLSREDHPLDNRPASYLQADAHFLPVCDGGVDMVFCHRFLNHLSNPADLVRVLKELARVSRRYVVVSCLGLPSLFRWLRKGIRLFSDRPAGEMSVEVRDLLRCASEAGLVLLKQAPIRRYVGSSKFLIMVKKLSDAS